MSDKLCEKSVKNDWIRKESKSRPNQFYLFNTRTGESRWDEKTTESSSVSEISENLLVKSNNNNNNNENNNKKSGEKSTKQLSSSVAQNAMQLKEKKISPKSRDGECLPFIRYTCLPLFYSIDDFICT